jgi:hypothetical protein
MKLERWRPRIDYTRQEQVLRRRLVRTGKLFGFLRECRSELFNEEFQGELETMYRGTGAGREPVPPAMLAMAVLLQTYEGVSDAAGRWCWIVWAATSRRSGRAHWSRSASD